MAFRTPPFPDCPTALKDASPALLFLDFHYGLKEALVCFSAPAGDAESAVGSIEAAVAGRHGYPEDVDQPGGCAPAASGRVLSRPRVEHPGVGRSVRRSSTVDAAAQVLNAQLRARKDIPDLPPERRIGEMGLQAGRGSDPCGSRRLVFECHRRVPDRLWRGRRLKRVFQLGLGGLRHEFLGHGFGRLGLHSRLRSDDSRDPDAAGCVEWRAGARGAGGGPAMPAGRCGWGDAEGKDERMNRDGDRHGGHDDPAAFPAPGICRCGRPCVRGAGSSRAIRCS